jgi:pimeloyl-ACP methyl ester carboxylesterase
VVVSPGPVPEHEGALLTEDAAVAVDEGQPAIRNLVRAPRPAQLTHGLDQLGGATGDAGLAHAQLSAVGIDRRSSVRPEVSAPVHLIYGENDWSRPSDRQANRQLLPDAEFTQVPNAGHFIALERPDVPADLLNSAA